MEQNVEVLDPSEDAEEAEEIVTVPAVSEKMVFVEIENEVIGEKKYAKEPTVDEKLKKRTYSLWTYQRIPWKKKYVAERFIFLHYLWILKRNV